MSDLRLLTRAELDAAKPDLSDWTFSDTAINRRIERADFSEAFALMCRIAMLAEKHNHHPDWSNAYNVVDVTLSTHDVGGLSRNDLALAKAIDKLLT